MNDRVIINRIRKRYPLLIRAVYPEPKVKNFNMLCEYFQKFMSVSGITSEMLLNNYRDPKVQWKEYRTIFIAVMVRLIDPDFFKYHDSPSYRFQKTMKEILNCNSGQIFYSLRKSRNFMKVYPEFRQYVNDIFVKITKE